MPFELETVIRSLTSTLEIGKPDGGFISQLGTVHSSQDSPLSYRFLNAAFLHSLAGGKDTPQPEAETFLLELRGFPQYRDAANFYLDGLVRIKEEIQIESDKNPDFANRLSQLAAWCKDNPRPSKGACTVQRFWSLFFPEGIGIWSHEGARIEELRRTRRIQISELNEKPVNNPLRQILFTSNVLLTLPPTSVDIDELPLSEHLKRELKQIDPGTQRYWYDHPIPIGVPPEQNEVIYGLSGLQDTVNFEIRRGKVDHSDKLTCLLSVSVTHDDIASIAKRYLREQFAHSRQFESLAVYLFTEMDTKRIIQEVLRPSARRFLGAGLDNNAFNVFGVNGAYGRHYSFLKAVSALWNVLVDPQVKATFKIDLDQVFPQEELLEQTGFSAFEHFKSPLWGAHGSDSQSSPVELGMLAGALVNESDISESLFTADVPFPASDQYFSHDQYVFYSTLPQALSTRAEMMARYGSPDLDGALSCLQRVHVTGGTNGILVDSLRRHRPFTPGFIGRAEDQAFLLSVFQRGAPGLVYLHKDGLIMRHDKEAFAQAAIQEAHIGKLVGDFERILYFSAYARALSKDLKGIKSRFDPFTGCFISHIPVTLCLLRFCLKVEALFASGQDEQAVEFIQLGIKRLTNVLNFAFGPQQQLDDSIRREREDWGLYYNTLDALEGALRDNHPFAMEMSAAAKEIKENCALKV